MKLGVEAALVDGLLIKGDVEVQDGRISAVGLSAPGGRGIAVPGFVDLQVNGFGGVDFLDADADGYRRAGEALLETGVTAYLPTLITSPEQQILAAMREVPISDARPRILGLHLEGPFLSPNRLGTHQASWRRDPDPPRRDPLLHPRPAASWRRRSPATPSSSGSSSTASISRPRRCRSCGARRASGSRS